MKKEPLRMCTGCRVMKTKAELVRVVKNKENEVFIDLNGKADGRGSYVCKSGDCLKMAIKKRALERNFKMKISEEIFQSMEKEINNEQ